jgi:DNA-binding IclR family transcriptional regulator
VAQKPVRRARTGTDRNRSASLRRALTILFAIAAATRVDRPPTLTELAEQTGIDRSTVLRLLRPLVDARLADQDSDTGRYRLGPQVAYLGQIYLEQLDVRRVASPVLHRLVEQSHETAHLGIPDGIEIVYADKVESPLPVRMVSRVGSRRPLYCTAMGKSYLAHADQTVLEAVLVRGMPRRTPTTLTSPDGLAEALALIRRTGYAIDDQENEPEIRCVAAPVFDHRGKIAAAISLSGPATRMPVERLHDLSVLVVEAAAEISRTLAAPQHSRPFDGEST